MELWKLRQTGEFKNFVVWGIVRGILAAALIYFVYSLGTLMGIIVSAFLLLCYLVIFVSDYFICLERAQERLGLCPQCGKEGYGGPFSCPHCGEHAQIMPRKRDTGFQELAEIGPFGRKEWRDIE